jgi:eukaryotic-like serine/threonine-protein kinase
MIPPTLDSPPALDAAPVYAGKYRLVRQLGAGGMGAIWAARNEATGAEVALKVLLPSDSAAELVQRLRREAHATGRLSHRNIVRVYDFIEFGDADEHVALVMELLHGRTLADHLDEHGKLSVDEAVAITLPILSALDHAHTHGVVHRDLKPENVFLAVDPDALMTPKILDFGISKLRMGPGPIITRQGEMLGTPSYMSPEQVRGQSDVDGRSDLFNVGILLYEMLSGRNPFLGAGLHGILMSVLEGHPPCIDEAPPAVWRVIERALAKSPDARFASAGDLAVALRSAVGLAERTSSPPESFGSANLLGPSPSFRPVDSTPPVSPERRRWPLLLAMVGAAFSAATVAGAVLLFTMDATARPGMMMTTSLAHAPLVSTPVVVTAPRGTGEPEAPVVDDSLAEPEPVFEAIPTSLVPRPSHAAVSVPAPSASALPSPPPAARSRFVARDPGF